MAGITIDELVTESIMVLEEKLELGFTKSEESDLYRLLSSAILREEKADA